MGGIESVRLPARAKGISRQFFAGGLNSGGQETVLTKGLRMSFYILTKLYEGDRTFIFRGEFSDFRADFQVLPPQCLAKTPLCLKVKQIKETSN